MVRSSTISTVSTSTYMCSVSLAVGRLSDWVLGGFSIGLMVPNMVGGSSWDQADLPEQLLDQQ